VDHGVVALTVLAERIAVSDVGDDRLPVRVWLYVEWGELVPVVVAEFVEDGAADRSVRTGDEYAHGRRCRDRRVP